MCYTSFLKQFHSMRNAVTSGLPKPITPLQNCISDANAKEQVRITRVDCRHKKQFPALQMICKLFLLPLLGQNSQASKP